MTQRFSKLFRLVTLMAGFSLLAAACGAPSSGGKAAELVVWKVFEDQAHMQPLLEQFRKKYPNVRVTLVEKKVENYQTELLNALAAGQGPDVFSINNAWLPQYIDKVVPTTEQQWTFNDFKNTFVDAVVNDFTRDRQIYGSAISVDSLALFYNKDLLGSAGIAVPPKTWDEMARDVQQLTRQNLAGYFARSGIAAGLSSQAPGGQVNRAEDILYLFMLQKGAQSWSADGTRPLFNQTISTNGTQINPAADALSYYTSFADPNSPAYAWNTRSDYSIDSFANGRAAFMINYSYARDLIAQKASTLNYDIAPVPQPSLDQPEVNFANYWGEVVSKQSKHPTEAWNFIKTITTKDSLDKYYATRKVPSSRKDLIELQTSDPDIGVFAHANLTAKTFYRPDQVKFDAIMAKVIDNVALRGWRPADALNDAVSQAAALATPRRN
ncbi:MAG: extracellular solute-binding protein [Candidatus Doudnabacteria bacterium]|nr:extracellular solute-binding protein [Candidatus Doudnabacteria bacterium]